MLDDPLVLNDWHVVGRASDLLPGGVRAVRLLGIDLVLWRNDAGIHAWLDRFQLRLNAVGESVRLEYFEPPAAPEAEAEAEPYEHPQVTQQQQERHRDLQALQRRQREQHAQQRQQQELQGVQEQELKSKRQAGSRKP